MALLGGAIAAHEEAEAVVEGVGEALGSERPAPHRRQLERERHPVEAADHPSHRGGVGVAEGEGGAGGAGPLHEELPGVGGEHVVGGGVVVGPGHRPDVPRGLPADAEGLTGRGQDGHARAGGEELGGEPGGGDQVLAVVEHQQGLGAQRRHQGPDRRRAVVVAGLHRGLGRPPEALEVGDRGEVDPVHGAAGVEQRAGHRCASRVLPLPPGPTRVTRRARPSSDRTSAWSS